MALRPLGRLGCNIGGHLLQGGTMRNTDIRAVGDLAGDAFGAGGALVRTAHEGIARRPFAILGPAAAPVRFVHDRVSRAVYGGVTGALRAAARGGGRIAALGSDPESAALGSGPTGSIVVGALNGFYGHHLAARGNPLGFAMAVRRNGADVAAAPRALAAAFPDATSRIVVFVHGLCGNDDVWRTMPLRGREAGRRTYGERLQDELSFTPVYLRYNTGLHISENGRALALLLEDLVAGWPCGVEELVLVGHSMGGLVARSACHYGEEDGLRWTDAVRHVFCLGTPHLGADLEKGVNVLGWALGRLPETRPLANILNARSVGIKDLRYGSCVDEDWSDCSPDEFLRDRCNEVPFLPDANYYFIGAALTAGAVGSVLGDLLVRMPSASGRGNGTGRRIPFEVHNGYELSGLTHLDLINHPAVYGRIRAWITEPPRRRLALTA
jgi:pimeloyl-ACP methyl ester carboxylesterase